MTRKFLYRLVFLALIGLPLSNAFAGELRCGTKLVHQGMLKAEVKTLCGEPNDVEAGGEVWIYDRGAHQFLKIVKFADDVVQFIDERQKQ